MYCKNSDKINIQLALFWQIMSLLKFIDCLPKNVFQISQTLDFLCFSHCCPKYFFKIEKSKLIFIKWWSIFNNKTQLPYPLSFSKSKFPFWVKMGIKRWISSFFNKKAREFEVKCELFWKWNDYFEMIWPSN